MLYKNALVGIITALVYSSGIAFGATATRGGSLRINTAQTTPTAKTSVSQPATQTADNPTRVAESYGDSGLVKLNKLTGSTAEARNILNALENRVNDLSVGYNSLDTQYDQLSTDVNYATTTATSAKTIAESARDQLNKKMNYGDFNTAFDARVDAKNLADQPYVERYVNTNVQQPDLSNYYNKETVNYLLEKKLNKDADFTAMFNQQLANQNLADADSVNEVSERVTNAENKISAVEGKLNAAEQNINNAAEQNTTTANKVTAAENKIAALENKITAAENSINSAAEQNTTTANKITAAENKITALENKITAAEQSINSAAEQSTTTTNKITAAENKITTIENKITAMEADSETLKQFKDNVALTAENLQTKVPELYQQINTAIDKADQALANAGNGSGSAMDQSTFNTYLASSDAVLKTNTDFVNLKDNALTAANLSTKVPELYQQINTAIDKADQALANAGNGSGSAMDQSTFNAYLENNTNVVFKDNADFANLKENALTPSNFEAKMDALIQRLRNVETAASNAATLATNAKTAADSAAELATNAKTSADSATELATSARTTAEGAAALATTAKTTAEGAAALAGEAKDIAQAADAKAQQALDSEGAN